MSSWKWFLIATLVSSSAVAAPDEASDLQVVPSIELTAAAVAAQADTPVNSDDPQEDLELADLEVETGVQAEAGSENLSLTQLVQAQPTLPHYSTRIIHTALEMIGIPYRRGGTNASSGFDCSGFVYAIYAQAAGHALPRVAHDQAKVTEKIEKKELKPGDLVFFNTMRRAFSHVGIYLGEGKFIHAPRRGKRVRVEDMNAKYWVKRFNGARRVNVAESSRDKVTHSLDNVLQKTQPH